MLLNALPERTGFAPTLERDLSAVFKGSGENRARFFGHFFVGEANHQLVVDIKAALIEVGRADINDVINDDQFRVEDLRLIFVNRNARFQKAPIETLAGELRKSDVGFTRENKLYVSPTASNRDQAATNAPGREKISHNNPHVAGSSEVGTKRALDGIATATWAAQEKLFVQSENDFAGGGFAQPDKTPMEKFGAFEHFLKGHD